MTPRAAPMPPEERREALVAVTLPLLRKHGREVTTRQIARAAGVAEGTIFRVFATKEALIDAALDKAFEPGLIQRDLAAVPRDLPLRERLLEVVSVLQRRYGETFDLMMKVQLVGPARQHVHKHGDRAAAREELVSALTELIADEADTLRIDPRLLVHMLRMLTFVGSHPMMSDGRLLTPEEIVDLVLLGALERPVTLFEERTA